VGKGEAPERRSIAVDKSANIREVAPSGTIIYTVNVTNTTSDTLTNLTVVDSFDAGKVAITNANQGNISGGSITWAIPELKAGERWIVRYSAKAGDGLAHGTVIMNTVVVSGSQIADIAQRLRSDSVSVNVVKELPQTGAELDDWYDLQNGPQIIGTDDVSTLGTFLTSALIGAALFFRRRLLLLGGAAPLIDLLGRL